MSVTIPARKIEAAARSIRDEARDYLEAAGGNVQEATTAMTDRALSDPAFLKAYLGDVVRAGCYSAVAALLRSDRRQVWTTPQPTSVERRAQVTALASGTVRTLLDFPLPGGKRLGDATRGEVSAAADLYGAQARDMSGKSRWLSYVAQSLPDGKRVADVLTAERLEELRLETNSVPA